MPATSPRVQAASPRVQAPTFTVEKQYEKNSVLKNTENKLPPFETNWQKRQLRPTQSRMQRRYGHERYRGKAIDYLHAQHISSLASQHTSFASHIFNAQGNKQTLDNLINGKEGSTKWIQALSNEWGRLATGNDLGIESTDTIEFVPYEAVPKNKKVTYATFACDYRPLKDEKWRI